MRVLPQEPSLLTKKSKKKMSPWNLISSSFQKKTIGDDDDDVAITTTRTSTTGKIHDTELVTAIKANEHKASHHTDVAQLEEIIASSSSSSSSARDSLGSSLNSYEEQLRSRLSQAVFVGHINTDLDSVAGAMGAADLFGGTAAISEPYEKLNGEIIYALENCGLPAPRLFDDLMTEQQYQNGPVCLVDHTEETQMVPSLRSSYMDRVIGVIDHHALAKSFQTKRPIFMDLRPWGSMSTILGYLFVSHRRPLAKPLAVLLMQAILSDTLNLRSVTTTEADRSMVALLHRYGGIGQAAHSMAVEMMQKKKKGAEVVGLYQETQIDYLSKKQFQAKTNWVVALGPYEMVRGDQKDFACGPWKFGISVLEVTDTTQIMTVASDILSELRLLKKEKALVDDDADRNDNDNNNDDGDSVGDGGEEGETTTTTTIDRTRELDFAFLFVVNIVTEVSTLLISGGRELALAKAAFLDNPDINNLDDTSTAVVTLQAAAPNIRAPGSTIHRDETAMTLPKGYVSRKAQFVPAFFQAIEDFDYAQKGPMSEVYETTELDEGEVQELAVAVQKQVEISKQYETSNNDKIDDSNDDNNTVEEKNNKRNKMLRHSKRRSSSSLHHSFRSTALQASIFQEQREDEHLVSVLQENIRKNNGNLYDNDGRVRRIYS